MDREKGTTSHEHFRDIKQHLRKGDCLVINDSKVLPARLYGIKAGTGAKIEFLLTKRIEGDTWETMVRPGKRLKPGDSVDFADGFRAVLGTLDECVLLPIYPAREEPIPGVTSEMLGGVVVQKPELVEELKRRVRESKEPVVVLTVGAGDIDRLVPEIARALKEE